ncbi:hypothetical protein F0562_025681 [Nyssa sinensis]|uniref:GAG-pre-integrase domain-containing protein n=1 Tax=Nyssa sinensis TaxID=561372 RepID=A0A5J5B8G4_9ASTE|nr:hypothetical protein F0562_025681 [Nyssa sinensis]
MSGHSVAKCYKIHGYPPGHKLHGKNKIFVATAAIVAPSRACSANDHDEESSERLWLLPRVNIINYWLCCILKTPVQPWPPCLLLHLVHLFCLSLPLNSLDLASWTTIGMGEVRDGLYHLLQFGVTLSLVDVLPAFLHKYQLLSASVTHKNSTSDLWHCRLGHISFSRLLLIDDPLVKQNLNSSNTSPCCVCPLAKQHRLYFPISTN